MRLFKPKMVISGPRTVPPLVYVSYYPSKNNPGCIRFFFFEEVKSEGTTTYLDDDRISYTPGDLRPGIRELLSEIESAVGADCINLHQRYIAVHWHLHDAPLDAEEKILGLLTRYFGWEAPIVDYFDYGSAKMRDIEVRYGVRWSPSS